MFSAQGSSSSSIEASQGELPWLGQHIVKVIKIPAVCLCKDLVWLSKVLVLQMTFHMKLDRRHFPALCFA